MRFTSVRLISADVKQLAEFYERVLARPATWSTPPGPLSSPPRWPASSARLLRPEPGGR